MFFVCIACYCGSRSSTRLCTAVLIYDQNQKVNNRPNGRESNLRRLIYNNTAAVGGGRNAQASSTSWAFTGKGNPILIFKNTVTIHERSK